MGVASVIRDYVEEMPATFGQDLDSQQQKVGAFVNFGEGCTLCTAHCALHIVHCTKREEKYGILPNPPDTPPPPTHPRFNKRPYFLPCFVNPFFIKKAF